MALASCRRVGVLKSGKSWDGRCGCEPRIFQCGGRYGKSVMAGGCQGVGGQNERWREPVSRLRNPVAACRLRHDDVHLPLRVQTLQCMHGRMEGPQFPDPTT